MAFTGLEDLIISESGEDGYFVVGLVDVLGQRTQLLGYEDTPPTGLKNREKLEALRSNTLVPVRQFRKDFYEQFRSYEKYNAKSPLNCIKGPAGELIESIDSEPIGVHPFSDLVALSLSLRSDRKRVPMAGVFQMTAALGMASLCSLYRGFPVRGGIELDVAWSFNKHESRTEIYGPALAKAYYLESKKAEYPRIVVGSNFLRYIELNMKLPEENNPNRQYAEFVSNLLIRDDDGQVVVNPLSTWYRGQRNVDIFRKMFERCLAVAEGKLSEFSCRGDSKLMDRYSRLVLFLKKNWAA